MCVHLGAHLFIHVYTHICDRHYTFAYVFIEYIQYLCLMLRICALMFFYCNFGLGKGY